MNDLSASSFEIIPFIVHWEVSLISVVDRHSRLLMMLLVAVSWLFLPWLRVDRLALSLCGSRVI